MIYKKKRPASAGRFAFCVPVNAATVNAAKINAAKDENDIAEEKMKMHRRHMLFAAAPFAASPAEAAASRAAQPVRALLMAQQEAWNRGDIPAFMTAYWNSPELAFIGATISRGWQATLENYHRRYPTRAAMGTLTFSEIEVHDAGPRAAWVFGRFALARTPEGGGPASGKFTLVLRQFKDGWKIILDHTSS